MDRQLQNLVILTVTKPAEAIVALQLMRMPLQLGFMVLSLASVLNSLLISTRDYLIPTEIANGVGLLDLVSPFNLVVAFFVVATASSVILTVAGRVLGGQGRFSDVLGFIAWLQIMRFLVEVIGFALMLISPALAALGLYMAGLYGLWIVLNFQNGAHGFDSLGKAAGSLVLAFFAIVILVSVLVLPFLSAVPVS